MYVCVCLLPAVLAFMSFVSEWPPSAFIWPLRVSPVKMPFFFDVRSLVPTVGCFFPSFRLFFDVLSFVPTTCLLFYFYMFLLLFRLFFVLFFKFSKIPSLWFVRMFFVRLLKYALVEIFHVCPYLLLLITPQKSTPSSERQHVAVEHLPQAQHSAISPAQSSKSRNTCRSERDNFGTPTVRKRSSSDPAAQAAGAAAAAAVEEDGAEAGEQGGELVNNISELDGRELSAWTGITSVEFLQVMWWGIK